MSGPELRRTGAGWSISFPDRPAFAEGLARAQEASWIGDLAADAATRELELGPTAEALRAGGLAALEARLAALLRGRAR